MHMPLRRRAERELIRRLYILFLGHRSRPAAVAGYLFFDSDATTTTLSSTGTEEGKRQLFASQAW
jgi:hypothetical protein